jgi:hypothetical protein
MNDKQLEKLKDALMKARAESDELSDFGAIRFDDLKIFHHGRTVGMTAAIALVEFAEKGEL